MSLPYTWESWHDKILLRMDHILGERGKLYPRDYTLEDLQQAEAQAIAELRKEYEAQS